MESGPLLAENNMQKGIFSTDWIAHHADRNPRAVACVDVSSGRTLSYGEFDHRISSLANALVDTFNVPTGARILILSRNDTDVFEIQFACHRASAIFVPLNWRLASSELEVIACDAEPSIIFYDSVFRGVAERIVAAASIQHSVEMKGGQASEYETIVSRVKVSRREAARTDQDIWALLYTSGTTGRPKGAQVTFGMAFCNAIVLGTEFRITAECKNLVVLPTFHTAGLNVFANPVFFYGGTNVVVREFDAALVVDLLAGRGGGITHMMGVPTTHAMLTGELGFEQIGSMTLREVCVAGAPCPVQTIERYAEVGIPLRQCWGMTEVGPLALLMPRVQPAGKHGSSGMPSIFAKLMIADSQGIQLPHGQVGELFVKGPIVTSGYWRRPDANLTAFTDVGWFKTGDAVYHDEEGFFFIVDRWKDMYISGGENVYPAEIESALCLLEGIVECAVVAMLDEKWGEVGRAFVVRKQQSQIGEAALKGHCEKHLARYKIPKEFVFIDELPRNASGKVLKGKLRDMQ